MKFILTSLATVFLKSCRSSAFAGTALSTKRFATTLSPEPTFASYKYMTVNLFSTSSDTSILDDLSVTLSGPDLPPLSSTAKRLFLVRHGEVINPGGEKPVFYGCLDVSLSPLGETEAKVRRKQKNTQWQSQIH